MYGQALSGIFIACLVIPVLPEMIISARKRFPRRQAQKVNTLASGLFNASLGIGQTIGPIASSAFYEAFGFESTQDIVALMCLSYGIIYLVLGTGYRGFIDTMSGKAREEAMLMN